MARPFTTAELREAYLAFFVANDHERYPSAPLVPQNDPTTMFTVAGMSQFKDMFLGRGTHPFTRATTCQKCMRTNDIMQVGRTPRHHTFFEMLGNFSFDDYFKREAIGYAWRFLTELVGFDPDRLWISVHDIDDEAWDIWAREIGVDTRRMLRLGDADNFWPASAPSEGPSGPGGCCSEIFWDYQTNDDPSDSPAGDSDRFVEIWNLVFPQFNVCEPRGADGRLKLQDLGRRNIDTGMGLERLAAVVQGKRNNFDNDLLQIIVQRVAEVTGVAYAEGAALGTQAGDRSALLRRIADHVRAITFATADGARPDNKGAGYVLRRLARRATLDLDRLGTTEPALHRVVGAVVEAMGVAYPEILRVRTQTELALEEEERQFRRTLRRGLDLLERELERVAGGSVFDGEKAFRLHETYGFPREVTEEILAERGLAIDRSAWDTAADRHRAVSASKGVEVFTRSDLLDAKPRLGTTVFVGYETLEAEVELQLLEVDGCAVERAEAGTALRFALDRTPFYAESGGQVADCGRLVAAEGSWEIQVEDVHKDEGLFVHHGRVVRGTAAPGAARALVDAQRRRAITQHHSATHLLQAALAARLGEHVEQQGSKVEPELLRFDFAHGSQPTREDLTAVEGWVRARISEDLPVEIREMPIEQARAAGARALFGEKYGATVRVVAMGQASMELCGGCHVPSSGAIGDFRIVREEASSAGVRRISAVAGAAAQALTKAESAVAAACAQALGRATADGGEVAVLARLLKAAPEELPARVAALAAECEALCVELGRPPTRPQAHALVAAVQELQELIRALRKEQERAAAGRAAAALAELLAAPREIAGVPLVCGLLPGADGKALQAGLQAFRDRGARGVAVLVGDGGGKAGVAVAVGGDWVARGLSAGELVRRLAPLVGGKGGGRADAAQGGGPDMAGIPALLAAVEGEVAAVLATGLRT